MIDIGDLKWIAGFLEGEGSFSYSKNIRVQASQMRRWPLEKLNSLISGKIHPVYSKNKPWGEKNYWLWDLSVLNSAALMMTLYPLMSPYRQGQIKKSLIEWKKHYGRSSPFCRRGHEKDGNTVTLPNGDTYCKICRIEGMKKCYLRQKDDPIYKKKRAEASIKWRRKYPEKAVERSRISNQKAKEKRKHLREEKKYENFEVN